MASDPDDLDDLLLAEEDDYEADDELAELGADGLDEDDDLDSESEGYGEDEDY
jgi:hypothetical protein